MEVATEEDEDLFLVPATVMKVVLPPGLEVFWSLALLLTGHHGATLDGVSLLPAIKTGKKRAPADRRGNGNGKKFKPNQGGGNQESNRRLWEACKAKWDATKLKEILDAKACLNCGRTGHRITDCRAPKPQV